MLDVSAYQGVIDFAKVKQSGYLAVAIKATDGVHSVDPRFHDNWKDAKDAGVARFAYHFFHPNLDGAARRTFSCEPWTETLARLSPRSIGKPTAASRSQADRSGRRMYAKVDKVYDDAGYHAKPFAHSYSSFFAGLRLPARFAARPLWLAGYVREDRLSVPSPWKTYDIWQYAGDALSPPVDGIDPRLKKDYDKYHGTIDKLLATYGR